MSRRPHIVKKVRTDFGPLFFHADLNHDGAIESMWIDHAQKMEESTVADLLDLVCDTFNGMVNEIQTPADHRDSPAGGFVASSLPSPLPEDKLPPGSSASRGASPKVVPGGVYRGSEF